MTSSAEDYFVTLTPGPCRRDALKHSKYTGCTFFLLSVTNQTESDIEVDWNRTMYLKNGQTSGTFMFEGVNYLRRNDPKSPDIIFPGDTMIKTIWPSNLVDYGDGWRHDNMESGRHGTYLSLKVRGQEVRERLETNISLIKAQ